MTDIVERLRYHVWPHDELKLEAAAEIERLTDEVGQLCSDIDGYVIREGRLRAEHGDRDAWENHLKMRIKLLEEENERLRSALQIISHCPGDAWTLACRALDK